MNPIFTLNYPEFLCAQELQSHLAKANDYSVLVPLSSQQKGYDLTVMRRCVGHSKVVTVQVKSSKTYTGTAGVAPRTGLRTFDHYMWLSRFPVPAEADFFILLGLYAPKGSTSKNTSGIWKHQMLLFTHEEMVSFMAGVRQRKTSNPDSHFGFGFDTANEAFQTRGHALLQHPDYSSHLLANRIQLLAKALACNSVSAQERHIAPSAQGRR